MKNSLSMRILDRSTIHMITNVLSMLNPSLGIPLEVSGRRDDISKRNTVIANRIVVTNPILSPLSTGIRKLVRLRNKSSPDGPTR